MWYRTLTVRSLSTSLYYYSTVYLYATRTYSYSPHVMRSPCHVNISRLYNRRTLSCSAFLLSPSFTSASAPLLFSLHPDPEVWVPTTTTTTILHSTHRTLQSCACHVHFHSLYILLAHSYISSSLPFAFTVLHYKIK